MHHEIEQVVTGAQSSRREQVHSSNLNAIATWKSCPIVFLLTSFTISDISDIMNNGLHCSHSKIQLIMLYMVCKLKQANCPCSLSHNVIQCLKIR
jgi:hypothetical protein